MFKIMNFKKKILVDELLKTRKLTKTIKKWRNKNMAKKVKSSNSLISLNLPGPLYES